MKKTIELERLEELAFEKLSKKKRIKKSRVKKKCKEAQKRRLQKLVLEDQFFEVKDQSIPVEVLEAERKVVPLWVEGLHPKTMKPFFRTPKNIDAVKKILEIRNSLLNKGERIRNMILKNNYYRHIFLVGWEIVSIVTREGVRIKTVKKENNTFDFRLFEAEKNGRFIYEAGSWICMFVQKEKDGKKYFVSLTSEQAARYKEKFEDFIASRTSPTTD